MTWMKGGHSGHSGRQAEDGSLMPGMATDTEILSPQLLADHHMGGVDMARACALQCEVPQGRQLAQGMVDAQQSEVQLMSDMLKERGSAPR